MLLGWKWHFKGNVCALEIRVVQRIQVPFFNGLRKEKWNTRQYLLGVDSIMYVVRMALLMPSLISAVVTGPSWEVAFIVILCSVRGCMPLKNSSTQTCQMVLRGNMKWGAFFFPQQLLTAFGRLVQ